MTPDQFLTFLTVTLAQHAGDDPSHPDVYTVHHARAQQVLAHSQDGKLTADATSLAAAYTAARSTTTPE